MTRDKHQRRHTDHDISVGTAAARGRILLSQQSGMLVKTLRKRRRVFLSTCLLYFVYSFPMSDPIKLERRGKEEVAAHLSPFPPGSPASVSEEKETENRAALFCSFSVSSLPPSFPSFSSFPSYSPCCPSAAASDGAALAADGGGRAGSGRGGQRHPWWVEAAGDGRGG